MSTRRENRIIFIVIAIIVIVVAFVLLDGGPWIKGLGHGSGSMGMNSLRWGQILIGAVIGFLLGWVASRRKW